MEGNYKKWINRINSKQDVLTDDNVGQFMDLELPTKLTPTSGDTVLGRDSLTGKAIQANEFPEKFYEIQRDSLLMYVQNDTLKNGDCIFGIKQNEWVICENN